ncbi:glutamine amidotransferase-related protein [Arcanobacterium ihumii]|uniref:glutamine amidotransferase-related protein n=1 Tax=Arcanobacterium ihumii TaxID=2138162 RepID=UPI000F52C37D|nr:gamma-glutamyl-gamma-aminobutyrate hydrolase family protein [Arcanobacterium ihumii]
MKPFAFLVSRPSSPIGEDEYRSFQALTEISESMLVRIRMDSTSFSDFDLHAYSGVIVSGSPFDLTIEDEAKSVEQHSVEAFLKELNAAVYADDFPYLGICFGLESMALYLGEALVNSFREDISAPEIAITDEGQIDPIFGNLSDGNQLSNSDQSSAFRCYTGHSEALDPHVQRTGKILAESKSCPVQAVRWKENIYGVQFHPEIDWEGIQLRVSIYAGKYFAEGEGERVLNVLKPLDVSAGAIILKNFIQRYFVQH